MRRWLAGGLAAVALIALTACGGDNDEATPAETTPTTAASEQPATDAPTLSPAEVNQLAATATVGEWLELETLDQLAVAERWAAVERSDLSGTEVLGAAIIEAELTDPATPLRDMFATIEETLAGPDSDPDATPDVKFTYTCDYILGDFTESSSGYRFVADVELDNQGDIGAVNRVTAIWRQIGTDPIKVTKTERVRAGATKRVAFTQVASSEEIDLHQSTGSECEVRVSTVDVFTP